jgi:hypothetical protein
VPARYTIKTSEFEVQHPRGARGRFVAKPDLPGLPRLIDLIHTVDQGESVPARKKARIKAGFAAVMDGTYAGDFTVKVSDVQVEPQSTTVEFDIRRQGKLVGAGVRGFFASGDGQLVVNHDILELTGAARGRGFASAFNAHMEDWYRANDVTMITVHAALDVGGYAWAAAGWDWDDSGDELDVGAASVLDRLRDKIDDLDESIVELQETLDALPDDWARRPTLEARLARMQAEVDAGELVVARADHHDFRTPGYPTPYEISQIGRRPGQKDGADPDLWWLGKRVMIGADWRGVKYLTSDGEAKAAGAGGRRAMMVALADFHHAWVKDHPDLGDDPGEAAAYTQETARIMAAYREET